MDISFIRSVALVCSRSRVQDGKTAASLLRYPRLAEHTTENATQFHPFALPGAQVEPLSVAQGAKRLLQRQQFHRCSLCGNCDQPMRPEDDMLMQEFSRPRRPCRPIQRRWDSFCTDNPGERTGPRSDRALGASIDSGGHGSVREASMKVPKV